MIIKDKEYNDEIIKKADNIKEEVNKINDIIYTEVIKYLNK